MSEERTSGALEMTWNQVFRVWWLLTWRGLAGLIIFGAAVGAGVGFILNSVGASQDVIKAASTIIGFSVFFLWGLVIVRMALNKKYRDFDLNLTVR